MLEKDYIESIQRAVLEKEQLIQINDKMIANEIFEVVNGMDNKVLNDYIKYYCYKYIDEIEDKSTNVGKCKLISTVIYPLIAPNSPYIKQIHKLCVNCENTKKFIDRINNVGEEIKYEMFENYIKQNKPLKNLLGQFFYKKLILEMVEQYIEINRPMFEKYIYDLISYGLENRKLLGKKMFLSTEVNTIISCAIIETSNLVDLVKTDKIFSIIKEQYNKYCNLFVNDYMERGIALKEINRCVINDTRLMETFLEANSELRQKFIVQRMNYYLSQRKMMSFENFKQDCGLVNVGKLDVSEKTKEYEEVKDYIESLYDVYAKRLIEGNREEITLSKEKWTLFYLEGPRINYRQFKFDDIKSEKFRYEIKLYMMDECLYRIKNSVTLSLVKDSVNFLYSRNIKCDSFANIGAADIRALDNYLQKDSVVKKTYNKTKERSVGTLAKTMYKLKDIIDFLIKYSKKNTLITPVPKHNPFHEVTYRNRDDMAERTDIIPDIVLEQLDKFKINLNPMHQLMYKIFENTGLRASSVCKLEESCLKPSRYPNVMILKYKSYKLKNYYKKKGKLEHDELIIPLELAKEIQAQIDETEELRKKYNTKYIFLYRNTELGKIRPSLTETGAFVNAVNRIIEKNNIIDYDGELWRFKSRQFRKTLVSIMMDNNATDAEIAYVLGHNSQQTVNRYYKEINEQKIENLNHKFFKKRFGIDIGEENLSQYSEKEKKCLYIDFVTNYSRVPLGYCSKLISDGPCTKTNGASRCEKCSRICTGKQFLSEWIKLRDDRERELIELIEYYSKHNIPSEEYSEYKEYQHIVYELNLYKDTIEKINGKCMEGV